MTQSILTSQVDRIIDKGNKEIDELLKSNELVDYNLRNMLLNMYLKGVSEGTDIAKEMLLKEKP